MEIRDLDAIHVFGWSFAAGGLAGLAWRLSRRQRVTFRQVVSALLSSGLAGIVSAIALRAFAPQYPEAWIAASIMVGLMGPDGIALTIRVFKRSVRAAISSAVEGTKDDRRDTQSGTGDGE